MELQSLEYFVEISRCASLSEAARKLNISQQGLSAYLKRLESHYGQPLAVRQPKLALTDAGKRLLRSFLVMRDEMKGLERDLLLLRNGWDALTVGVFEPLSQIVMSELLFGAYAQAHENVGLEFITGSGNDIIELVRTKRADVGLTSVSCIEDAASANEALVFHWLSVNAKCLIVRGDLLESFGVEPRKSGDGYALADFSELPLVLPVAASGINHKVRACFRENGLRCHVLAEGGNEQMISGFVRTGRAAGICMQRNAEMIERASPGRFRVFPLTEPGFAGKDVLVTRRDAAASGALKDLIRLFIENWNAV